MPEPFDDDLPGAVLDERTAVLQQRVAAVMAETCAGCGAELCGHGALLAVMLGYRTAPRCASCLAAGLGEATASLCERSLQWIVRRDCFLHVWRAASAAECQADADRPACHFAASPPARATANATPPVPAAAGAAAAASYDAGDLGCGDLVLELRTRMRALPAGGLLHLVARDPAAPVDLPAWCGLVGHDLLTSDHPHYVIRRKRDGT
jgi:tRNA 2-thiouridine synthesizing protein A